MLEFCAEMCLIILFQNRLDLNGQGSRRYTGRSSILHILSVTMVTGLLCYLTTSALVVFLFLCVCSPASEARQRFSDACEAEEEAP